MLRFGVGSRERLSGPDGSTYRRDVSPLAEYGVALVVFGAVTMFVVRIDRVVRVVGRAGGPALRGLRCLPFVHNVEPRVLPPLPGMSRPIELIAADVRRLRRRYRTLPQGVSFAKVEGVRRAYDGVLLEACGALEIVTLLGVLPNGTELDRERERVEYLLEGTGLNSDAA